MKLLSILPHGLLCLAIVSINLPTTAQATGHQRCCTAVSRVHPEKLRNVMIRIGGRVQCQWQSITEGCNISAILLKLKGREVCMNPKPVKMRKLLAKMCSNRKAPKRVRKPGRSHRKKSKI